jgi:RHS repeat-associated protein
LLFYNARYYDPLLGRFVSADWIVPNAPALTVHPFGSVAGGTWGKGGGGPANAQDLNRYSYVNNSPVSHTDPTGHCRQRSRCAAQGGGGGAVKGAGSPRGASSPNGAMKGAQAGATRQSGTNSGANASAHAAQQNATRTAPPVAPNSTTTSGYVRDVPTSNTNNWSATYRTEGEARAVAREQVGKDPILVEPYKLRSQDGRWQYRAKPGDYEDHHVHLEELNPRTGEVIQNVHLRWPPEGSR